MKLTPKEQDRLTIFTLAELARRRRTRGIKLNYPEAVALICDEVMEEARAGRSYDEVVAHGKQVLTEEDVMEGVAELASRIYVEPLFDDGTKLVVLHHPIQKVGKEIQEKESVPGSSLPDTITINAGKLRHICHFGRSTSVCNLTVNWPGDIVWIFQPGAPHAGSLEKQKRCACAF